jgi:hypothetical protein
MRKWGTGAKGNDIFHSSFSISQFSFVSGDSISLATRVAILAMTNEKSKMKDGKFLIRLLQ